MTARSLRLGLAVLVVLATAEFVVRGPLRFVRHGAERSTDFTGPYLGARALVRGLNPYSSDVFWTMAEGVGWTTGRTDRQDDFESRSPYPLPTFVLMAPLAALSWQPARLTGIVAMAALFVASLVSLASLEGFGNARERRLAFLAFGLALAPVHSGLGAGNLVTAAVAFTLLGVWAMSRDRNAVAGICLALAACIKPPIAAPLIGYALLRGRWRIVAVAAGVAAVLAGAGAVRLLGTPWLSGYIANNTLLLADSGTAVVKWSAEQQQFINVHYLGYLLFDNPRVINALALTIGAALSVAWLVLLLRRPAAARLDLLEASTIAVASLLPIYHRVYDAGLLLLPLAWLFSDRRPETKRHRLAALLLTVPFLVPGSTWLELQASAGRLPAWVAGQRWWTLLVVPHQVWALLLLAFVLLSAQAATVRAARQEPAG